jgi:hypothetical protein
MIWLCGLAFVQGPVDSPVVGTDLPSTVQPSIPIRGLNPKTRVSATEYHSSLSKEVTRVYRYVFQADYQTTVKRFLADYPKSAGWNSSRVGAYEMDLWKFYPSGNLAKQGLIIQAARLVKDKASPTGWKALPPAKAHGWVWISYNEEFRSAPKK